MTPQLDTLLNEAMYSVAHKRLAKSVNASAIGHPCARALAFDQVRVVDGDPDLQPIFALGNTLERQAMIDLQEALAATDMRVVRQQTPIPPNQYGIGGIVDLFIERSEADGFRHLTPVEFKSCSPHVFPKLNTLADLKDCAMPWVRKWPAQLTVYMLLTDCIEGILLLRDKVSGRYKQIHIPLDYEYAETLLARAELVTAAVVKYKAAQTDEQRVAALPPRIPFDPKICEGCPHYSVCIPDPNSLPELDNRLWDVHLDALCRRVQELEESVDEYENAMEQIRGHCKSLVGGLPPGQQRTSITENFFVTAKPYQMTSAKVPDDIRKKYETKGVGVRVTIKRIGEKDAQ